MFKTVCSEGMCSHAKESLYYCYSMDEKTGIFKITNSSLNKKQSYTFRCTCIDKMVTWTEYGLEYVMREIIKKHEESEK